MFRICSAVKPRRFKPSEFTLCGTAGRPTAMTYGGTSRVTAALWARKLCAPTLRELMHRRQPAHDHPVAELDVAAERGAIRHHDLVPEAAIVGDVRIGHEQIVVADARNALPR